MPDDHHSSLGDAPNAERHTSLPHNLEAEQFLLGAILLDNESIERVDSFLLPEHFYDPVHGRIYEVIKRRVSDGFLADPVTLKNHFASEGSLADLGGEAYLRELAASVPSLAHVADYGRAIFEAFQRRGLVHIGQDMVARALDQQIDNPANDQIATAEHDLYSLAEVGRFGGGFASFNESAKEAILAAEAAFRREGHLSGIATGLDDLDHLLGGLQNSDLVIVAGRPGMGKTALGTNIAFNAARRSLEASRDSKTANDGAVVAFFSLEMSRAQLAQRILSATSHVPSDLVRRGQINQVQYEDVCDALGLIQNLPLFIDDTGALSIAALSARARRLKRAEGLGLIVIDYLQLMTTSGQRRHDSRVQEVTEITTGLKALAKELDVPIIALSQLSRQVESRDDKRPQLSDLRESGSIEQDADIVMFVYREEYYLRNRPPAEGTPDYEKWEAQMASASGKAEVIVAKQRHGPTGSVDLQFNGELTSFGNLERHDYGDVGI
jgi:replicative DNA helicase